VYGRRLILAALAAATALTLAACGGAPDQVTATMADNGAEILIAKGGTLTVSLPATIESDDPGAAFLSSTGGPWQAYDPPMVLESIETSPVAEGSQTADFTYEAVAEGEGELRLWYAMPTTSLTQVDTEIFSVRVIVE